MSKWDEAADQLAQGLITILKENDALLPENVSRVQDGAKQFIQTIRAAVWEECGNLFSSGRSSEKFGGGYLSDRDCITVLHS